MITQISRRTKVTYRLVNKKAGTNHRMTVYVRVSLKGNSEASYKNLSANDRSGIDHNAAYKVTYVSQAAICKYNVTFNKISDKNKEFCILGGHPTMLFA